jgi:hypothetical protein
VDDAIDRKTAAFYLTLLGMVVLDIILLLWIFSPFAHLGTRAFASEKPAAVTEEQKPSPFDIADSKRQPVQPLRSRSRVVNASSSATSH